MLITLYAGKVYIEMFSLKRIYLKSTYWNDFSKWYFASPMEQIIKYPCKHTDALCKKSSD